MILRNPLDGRTGQPDGNVFEAVDPRTADVIGSCRVTGESIPQMYPDRPYQVRLDISGDVGVMDALIGAALARARAMCIQSGTPGRIYTCCRPSDSLLMDTLGMYGFRDGDGLMRMRAPLPAGVETPLPVGCVMVEDKLDDVQEQYYFLQRYNELTGENRDVAWLANIVKRDMFRRLLAVSNAGMVGEVLVWRDKFCGVVEFFNTARRWRNHGVATHMIYSACGYLKELGLREVRADVRLQMNQAKSVLEEAGFKEDTLMLCYPCIDV